MALHSHDDVVDPYWHEKYHFWSSVTTIDDPGDEHMVYANKYLALVSLSLTRCDDL